MGAGLFPLATQVGTHVSLLMVPLARLAVAGRPRESDARARFRFTWSLLLVHLALLFAAWSLDKADASLANGMLMGAALAATIVCVVAASVVAFEGILLRFVRRIPRIVPDLVTMFVAAIALVRTSSQLGFELSGVIATSAVLTAVIGLALQDTLGNALGGLTLQFDESIKVGDWVNLGHITGRVSEIRWRYTAIETAAWDTIIVPNRELMRAQVAVVGRRRDRPVQCRRLIDFRVDFRHAPNDVIRVIEDALQEQSIAAVASSPAPHCLVSEFGESQIRYTVRYWVDPDVDMVTDSAVRACVYYALARAKINLAIPVQRRLVTTDDPARKQQKKELERARRLAALRPTDLFATLNDEDLKSVADRLERVPFAKGETITREGTDGRYLYMIRAGMVSVRVGGVTARHEINRLQAGDFFGEMALLTGSRRTATSVALTDVDCYRLDAEGFGATYERHAQFADYVAKVIAERETGLVAAHERLSAELHAQLQRQKEHALSSRIRSFFERI